MSGNLFVSDTKHRGRSDAENDNAACAIQAGVARRVNKHVQYCNAVALVVRYEELQYCTQATVVRYNPISTTRLH